jgi:RimJ/RimL family protein N-acetyltransferase
MTAASLLLVPFEKRDFNQLVSWINSPDELGQWAGTAFALPLTEGQWFAHVAAGEARGGHEIYKAVDGTTGISVGHVEFAVTSRAHGTGWIGRVLVAPDLRRRGLGLALMHHVLALAFRERELHRVELGVFDFNRAAIACYERVGFRREGVRRESYKGSDGYWNSLIMGILAPEWQGNVVGGDKQGSVRPSPLPADPRPES